MKQKNYSFLKTIAFLLISMFVQNVVWSQTLRRPVSPSQPMWLIHIDSWNYPDPQKIIDLIPQDVRPYVVMNISLSSFNDGAGRFQVSEYGYEIAKSWLRTCAENRMWAMVQPSSGAYSHFPDNDMTIFEELYQNYPNLIGFNYCEQSWGYVDNNTLASPWEGRINHFAKLLALSNTYGGYLVVSWCGNKWVQDINPIAMLKRNTSFATACATYTKNYILSEKYTYKGYQSDMESVCLGAYLSGWSGQYAIRYDNTGWTDKDGNGANFTLATYGAPFLEHVMLTGQTVIDGPEIIWHNCFKELSAAATTDGYTMRRWETFPQFDNVSVDLFRKVIDGTVRIPTRQEVIDRTKLVIINNVNSGTNDEKYSTPETMFEGLYRMDGDGNYELNKSFFKKTGRYPTIPTVYSLNDQIANSFSVKVNKSDYASRWPNINSKVTEFNNRFPQESTGDIYAGRHENGWVVYNPFKTGQIANGNIQLKYNTCTSMDLSLSLYTAGVVKEYSNKVDIYLSNYDNQINTDLKTDVIKIYGSSSEPSYTITDRGVNLHSIVTKSWSGGVFTLTLQHNGPVDIRINCSGSATGRLTNYTVSAIVSPAIPPVYMGTLQYEAETFDYKNIAGVVKSGYSEPVRNYSGQGYINFGTSATASVRDTVTVPSSGIFTLNIKYSVTGLSVNTIDLYVNGTKVSTPNFTATATNSDWAVIAKSVSLNSGKNTIELRSTGTRSNNICFDNITIEPYNSPVFVEITAPNDNAQFTAPASVTLSASASSTAGTITKVDFFLNNVRIVEKYMSPYNWPVSNLATGTYTIKVIAYDNSGNTAEDEITITVSPVTVSITAPGDNAQFTAPASVTLSASASSTVGTITKVDFFLNNVRIVEKYMSPYNWPVSDLAAGTYIIKVIAYDNSGNTAEDEITIIVSSVTVSITAPNDNAQFTAPASLTLSASASTIVGTMTKVDFYLNNVRLVEKYMTPYNWPVSDLAAGIYTIKAIAYNSSGNTAEDEITITVSPSVPVVASPVNYIQNSTAAALTATGTALKWYSVATGGTASATAPIPSTTTVGTTNYYVSQTVNGCESQRATIAVVVSPLQLVALETGWNLISINVHPADSTIATLFNGLDVQEIKTMDAFWRNGQNGAFNSLKTITAGKGYLVNMNTAGILSIDGLTQSHLVNISTINGWQLIGCTFQSPTPFSDYFNTTNSQIIKNFDGFWIPNGTTNSIQNLEPGKAYFIKK